MNDQETENDEQGTGVAVGSSALLGVPHRVQRKRSKGWRMPPNTVYVGRPTRFGNPFNFKVSGREKAVKFYSEIWSDNEKEQVKIMLHGKNLACWCSLEQICHADVLLEIANS